MEIVPFDPSHMETLDLQDAQQIMLTWWTPEYARALKNSGQAFSGILNGQTIFCAGVARQWDNRGAAWSMIGRDAGAHFVQIHRAVRRFLDLCDIRRIEAYVDADFAEGHRWMQMLGFEREGRMRAFLPLGNDCDLYARVKWTQ